MKNLLFLMALTAPQFPTQGRAWEPPVEVAADAKLTLEPVLEQYTAGLEFDNIEEFKQRFHLDQRLAKRLDQIDSVCRLTPEQFQKLELAGKVEIRCLFESITVFRRKVASIPDAQTAQGVILEAQVLNVTAKSIFVATPKDSLMNKVARGILTDDQILKYDNFTRWHRKKVRLGPTGDAKSPENGL